MLHGNTLWLTTKILIVQSTEKRLICLKIQVIQVTRATPLLKIKAAIALIAKKIVARTEQVTVAKTQVTAPMKATKALIALMLQDRASKC